jgi:aspartyl-tRNA(Asn)/glutamyl-tRNA(Gln) amidotransferase subunit B
MRSKETAQDYRYFPDPDLPPLVLDEAFVEGVRREMPELPRDKRSRFIAEYKLPPAAAQVLTQHPRVAAFFEETVKLSSHTDAVRVANFVQSEVLRDVVTKGLAAEIPVAARQVADVLGLVAKGTISGKQAKEIYQKLRGTTRSAEDVVRELGMAQVSDASALEPIVKRIVDANPKQAEQLRAGKTGLMGYFVGQVMKETKGSANPQLVNELLKKHLGV